MELRNPALLIHGTLAITPTPNTNNHIIGKVLEAAFKIEPLDLNVGSFLIEELNSENRLKAHSISSNTTAKGGSNPKSEGLKLGTTPFGKEIVDVGACMSPVLLVIIFAPLGYYLVKLAKK
ncbi:MAG: hypothetical protein ACJARP_002073 [Vicingaceae bacterium]